MGMDAAIAIGGSMAGSGLAAGFDKLMGGMTGSGNGDNGTEELLNQYNSILNNALNNALNTSSVFTNSSIQNQQNYEEKSREDLNRALSQASQQNTNYTDFGFNLGQSLLAPQRNAGYAANDAYLQSLGLATPIAGSQALADAGAKQQQLRLLNDQWGGGPPALGPAPSAYQAPAFTGKAPTPVAAPVMGPVNAKNKAEYDAAMALYASQKQPYDAYQAQLADYNNQLAAYNAQVQQGQLAHVAAQQAWDQQAAKLNQYNTSLQKIGITPEQQSLLTQMQNGSLPMTQQGQGLQNFFNTPNYQLLYGPDARQANPVDRFKFDPGYEFAQQEAAKKMQQYAASKGLLESGPLQVELQRQAQGMADQNYQRWLEQQNAMFGNYQNNLMGLTSLGSQLTGANTAASLYSNLGNQLGQYNVNTGNQLAQVGMNTGQNISGLFANQGVLNANAYLNTGAAQAQGLMNIAQLNAQLNSQAAASRAQSQSGQMTNQGYQDGAGLFGGGGSFSGPQSYYGSQPYVGGTPGHF